MITGTLTTPDGFTLHTIHTLPQGAARAVVIVVHGYGEHSGRYEHVLAHLSAHGYAAYALDHRGFGRSSGLRGYVARFDHWLADLKRYVDHVSAKHAGLPVFMLGHSLGALISLAFALRHQDQLAGLIVNGAPLYIEQAVKVHPLLRALAGVLNVIVPRAALVQFGGQRENLLSSDPEVDQRWKADPLVYRGKARVRTALEIDATIKHVNATLATLTLPLLVTHGMLDELALPEGSRMIHDQARSTDKTLTLYDGMQHEVYNEIDQHVPLNDVVVWLDARAQIATTPASVSANAAS